MSREVPPRFRNHQEHKILLKRGQSLDGISPFLHTGDQSHVTTTLHSDPNVDLTSSPPLLSLSSLTYANSTCGPGPGAPLLSQGMAKIVMDKSRSRRQSESLNKTSWEYNQSKQEDNSEQVEPGVTADEENSESVPSSHCETALNRADAESMQQIQSQDDGQSVENRVEEEVGPKQVEAATDCKTLNQAVQLPTFTSNLEVLIPDTCHRKASGEVLKPGEMWGTSVESQVGWKVSHEVSQTVQAETGSGLKKQVASESRGDVPKEGSSGHVKENPPDCLQDTQMIATKTVRRDREKGANESERDGSEHQSSGHGSSEDGTCSNSTSRTQSSCTEVTLQRMLNRSDLDPRVLSNTGWGQIQIKQSIAWNLEVGSRSETGQDWTGRAQVDVNSLSCPSWSRDLQGHVKGSRSHGTGNTWGQSEERIESKQGALLTGRDNSWVEAIKDEQEVSWHGNRKEALQQREQDRGSWGLGKTQWGENKGRAEQGERSWADSEDEGQNKQQQVWGDNRHPQHTPNNHMALQSSNQQHLQHSHSQLTPPNNSQESKDPPTGPLALNQNSGWKPGPIPHTSSAIEPSGWEEPSPQSISRKMEIDDGTSAWGDPTHYDHRSVNMWDKSNLQQRSEPSQQHHESMSATTVTSRDKNAAWERSAGASEQSMNTSAAGWGKAFDAPSSWRDPEESGKGTVWGSSPSNSSKTGPKTMQDGWSDEGLKTSHHSSWEEEDSGSGMWGNRSQDNSSSFSSGGWNHGGRRTGGKAPLKGNGASSWTGSVTRQMSNMAITTGVFNTSAHLRGVQQPGVHHINPSPGVRAQVPQQFLPPQVSGSVVNPMFPTHSSPQHLALLGGLHPHMQQVQLAYQLLLQQQQQQQQHHFLSHRKFPHHLPPPPPPPLPPLPLIQHQDPQQIARIMAVLQQLPKSPTSFPASSWPPEPIGHRTNRNASQMPRPPPGLTHQKPAPWLGAGPNLPRGWSSERQNQEGPFVPGNVSLHISAAGQMMKINSKTDQFYFSESSWSGGSSTGSSWLLLSNLTPQHGPLMTFNLGVAQGSALIRYCSVDEAAKAQSALHMCVLGNTTILAEFVSEEDVARYFTHSQSGETVGEADRQTDSEMGGGGEMKLVWENLDRDQDGLSLFNRWSHSREGGVWGGGAPGYQSNNLWGSPQVEDRGPGLLPGNLLGGGADT
ncbi:trinucleotide repeat-containingprotein 6B protein-like isoform X2 [Silurus asotus]|uniref:Trinucleotide repeat-containingprotein 6B protein-like isoform X2 n=1 Tax=Silurus asotus TaxID=30991 RepID=A0AAD5FQJ9_SILAS|nr:trinucleotide repeat-containingprotein 6B protein-like isoform X2 [Silurus asotus]